MDVELQILKHKARDAQPTVSFIDKYCNDYKDLFSEVRSYECFKYLHLGIISKIKKKSLPEIAKVVGLKSAQSLHHFLSSSPWDIRELRKRRVSKILALLKDNYITVVIDETGDRKKGKRTDCVARQYLGSIGKIEQGIVSVNAYGIYQNITFPLLFRVFKPKGRLKAGDKYLTKIELAKEIIFGKRSSRNYWEITIDPETLPANSTSFVMTNLKGNIKETLESDRRGIYLIYINFIKYCYNFTPLIPIDFFNVTFHTPPAPRI